MTVSREQRAATPIDGPVKDAVGGNGAASAASVLVERVLVRRGSFHDPLTLMEASEAARALAGVGHVAVGMVEPLNMVILTQRFGYAVAADGLGPNDLVIAVRAEDEAAADAAVAAIDAHLAAHAGEREVLDVGAYVFGGDGAGPGAIEWRGAGNGGGGGALGAV